MVNSFDFNTRKVWEFVTETKMATGTRTASEIYESQIENNPSVLVQYSDYKWSGLEDPHPMEKKVLESRNWSSRITEEGKEEFPTYLDLKYSRSSAIFEAHEIIGMTPDQLQEAEGAYYTILEKLNNGEELEEGFLGALVGGSIGALAGPSIGRAICKALGIDENGNLGKLLTSRLVTTAIGISLGK